MVHIPMFARYVFERTLIFSCVVSAQCLNDRKDCNTYISNSPNSDYKSNMAAACEGLAEAQTGEGNKELILYQHHHSFYVQKVLMALYEKNIPFSTKYVDITKGDNYQPWYLKINPRGEVPVLQDGIKIIPDSVRIIDYLEDNFSNGEHKRLVPLDQGTEVKQKVVHFRTELEKIPANAITVGAFFHPEFMSDAKYPFVIPSVQNHLKSAENHSASNLRKYAEENPESRDILLAKAAAQDKKHAIIVNKDEFKKMLDSVVPILDEVEKELASHTEGRSDWWLCSNDFTTADIDLTITLDRLARLGLAPLLWGDGKHPKIVEYYKRVQKRNSYKKAVPGVISDMKRLVSCCLF